MRMLSLLALLFLAACGSGAGDPAVVCRAKGGQWTQVTTYDALGHAFTGYHCFGGG